MLLFYLSIVSVGILTSKLAFAAPLPSHTPPDSPTSRIDLSQFSYTADDYEALQRGTLISHPPPSFGSSSSGRHQPRPLSPPNLELGWGRVRGNRRGSRRAENLRGPATTESNMRNLSVYYTNMDPTIKRRIQNVTIGYRNIYEPSADRNTFLDWLACDINDDLQERLISRDEGVVQAAVQGIVNRHHRHRP